MTDTFDTFLSHNSKDKPTVRDLGLALKQRGLRVWLDEWELIPGRIWMDELEKIILSTRSALVLVGPSGLGPWEEPEMRACIAEFVKRRIPVIPVLLPGTTTKPVLPIFLNQFTWVDLRYGLDQFGLDQLQWGITGVRPQRAPHDLGSVATAVRTAETRSHATSAEGLIPEKTATVRFSVVFTSTMDENDRASIDGLMARLRDLANDQRLTLISIEKGSTRFIVEGTLDGLERLEFLFRAGQINEILGQPVESIRRNKLVILVHGIRTRAEWQTQLIKTIGNRSDVTVVGILYGYFDVFRFLSPIFGTRSEVIAKIKLKMRMMIRDHASGNPEIIVIAHSFGTYAVSRILRDEPDIQVDKLLLCGSIIPPSFKWESLPNCPNSVLNDVGTKDYWPVLATAATWGFGSTGTFGFGAPRVRDRFHTLGHSDFFSDDFIRQYWRPWVQDGLVIEDETKRQKTPWLLSIAEFFPFRWITAGGTTLALGLLAQHAARIVSTLIKLLQ
jgi:TIR domain